MSYPAPILNLNFANAKQLVHPSLTFSRSSQGSEFDSSGVLRYVGNNVPRFDHDPLTGICKGLLVEPAVTFINTYSEQFNVTHSLVLTGVSGTFQVGETVTGGSGSGAIVSINGSTLGITATSSSFSGTVTGGTSGATGAYSSISAAWVLSGAAISPNSGYAPDGNLSADALIESTDTGEHRISTIVSATVNNSYTMSLRVKTRGNGRNLRFTLADNVSPTNAIQGIFSPDTGQWIITPTSIGNASGASGTITPLTDGSYNVSISGVPNTSGTSLLCRFNLMPSTGSSYTGDGASGINIWGANLYAGTGPASYLPTTTAGVTRAADICSVDLTKLTRNGSPLWTGTEGTIVIRGYTPPGVQSAAPILFDLSDGTNAEYFRVQRNSSMQMKLIGSHASSSILSVTGDTIQNSTEFCLIAAFDSGVFSYSFNGAAASPTVLTKFPYNISKLFIGLYSGGTTQWGGTVKAVQIYNRRIADAYLPALSAL